MTAFVLDNSVTMRWCFEDGDQAYADLVLRTLVAPGGGAVVPILWRYEVSAVLARAEVSGQLSSIKAAEFIATLRALPIAVDQEASHRILDDVHRLAVTYRLTSYDAAYLELAQRLSLPIATLDAELLTAARSAEVTIIRLVTEG